MAEYLDRSATVAIAVVIVILATIRTIGRLNDVEKRCAVSGCVWFLGAYALTVFLPVRSSLYACWPSVGAAIVAAAVASAMWRHAPATARRRSLVVLVLLTLLLLPIYRSRNLRLKREAQLSATVLNAIGTATRDLVEGDAIVVYDNRSQKPSIYSAFGSLLPDAVLLTTGKRLAVWLEPPASEQPPGRAPDRKDVRAAFALGPDGFRRIPPGAHD